MKINAPTLSCRTNASTYLKAGILTSTLLFLTYSFAADEVKEASKLQISSGYRELSPITKRGELSALNFSTTSREKQSLKDGGVNLRVSIRNNGTEELPLRNPLEFFHVMLIDESGHIVSIEPPVYRTVYRLKTSPEEARPDREFPFTLNSVSVNDHLLSKSEINALRLDLLPTDNLAIDLTFNKIYQKQTSEKKIVPIPAGRYDVRTWMTVRDAASIKIERAVQLKVITVQLTE